MKKLSSPAPPSHYAMGQATAPPSSPGLLPLDPHDPRVAAVIEEGDIEQDFEVDRAPIARWEFKKNWNL